MKKAITWHGKFDGMGAYPLINRNFTRVLKDRGYIVRENLHNVGKTITPTMITCTYPPTPVPKIQHDKTVCIINWEFVGENNVPQNWLPVFETYDVVWAKSRQCYDAFKQVGIDNVVHGRLGIDPIEFQPLGEKIDYREKYNIPDDSIIMFWVGGTDPRHGFDIALNVLDECPDNVYLIAKQHPDYPVDIQEHKRLHIITEPIESLAPYYRGADMFLQTARAVGYSLPTAEALACGLPVVSTFLPAIAEFMLDVDESIPLYFARSELKPMRHHIHRDCNPYWWEPIDISEYVMNILAFGKSGVWDSTQWRQAHSWEKAVDKLEPYL